MRKAVAGDTLFYVRGIDGSVLAEYGAGGQLATRYIYAGGTLIAHVAGGVSYYYVTDYLGSTRRVMAAGGGSNSVYDYRPYGLIYDQSGDGSRYEFTGLEQDDESTMVYTPGRLYDPYAHRFLQTDPLFSLALSRSPYHYARNSPLVFIDPMGLQEDVGGLTEEQKTELKKWGLTEDQLKGDDWLREIIHNRPVKDSEMGWQQLQLQQLRQWWQMVINYLSDNNSTNNNSTGQSDSEPRSYGNIPGNTATDKTKWSIPIKEKEKIAGNTTVSGQAYQRAIEFLGQSCYSGECNLFVQDVYGGVEAPLTTPRYANIFESDPRLVQVTDPVRGDIVQLDRGGNLTPHGHVAIYAGNGRMITTTSKTIRILRVNDPGFSPGSATIRYLRYR